MGVARGGESVIIATGELGVIVSPLICIMSKDPISYVQHVQHTGCIFMYEDLS